MLADKSTLHRASYGGGVQREVSCIFLLFMMHAALWGGCAAAFPDDCIDDAWATARSPINPTQTAIFGTFARQQALSSNHSDGIQVALFDGSVRFLTQNVGFVMTGSDNVTVADSVYERLIHKSDGATIGDY